MPEPLACLSKAQNQVLMAGLAKKPEARPQTATQLVALFAGEQPNAPSDQKDSNIQPISINSKAHPQTDRPALQAKSRLKRRVS